MEKIEEKQLQLEGTQNEADTNFINTPFKRDYSVAFAGFTKSGEDPQATSTYNRPLSDWAETQKDIGSKFHPLTQSFEPVITGTISVSEVGDSEKGMKELEIPAGLIAVFGRTGVGKSQLAARLAIQLQADYIRFGEPEVPSIHDPIVAIKLIDDFINSDKKFAVIDSFRPWFYMVTKKASIGKGGVNNALYMDLTALSSICTMAGKTLFALINPLTTGKDDVENVRSNLESSTMGLIDVTSYGQFSFVARTDQNRRTPIHVELDMAVESMIDLNKQVDKKIKRHSKQESRVESTLDLDLNDKEENQGGWFKILNELKKLK